MTGATGSGPTGVLTGTGFSYDGNGNQTSAKSNPGRTTTYNDRDQAITTTPTGGPAQAATYAGAGNLDRLTQGGATYESTPLSPAPGRSSTGGITTWTIRDPDGQLIALRQGPSGNPGAATSYYPFTDQVGSIRTLVSNRGDIEATYDYTAYGLIRAKTGTLQQPYQYAGGHTDTSTGLIKLGYRYYDPTFGRFTQPDPSGQEAAAYLYAAGSPCTLSDPTGLAAAAKRRSCALQYLNLGASGIFFYAGIYTTAAGLVGAPFTGGTSAVISVIGIASTVYSGFSIYGSIKQIKKDGCDRGYKGRR